MFHGTLLIEEIWKKKRKGGILVDPEFCQGVINEEQMASQVLPKKSKLFEKRGFSGP